MSNPRGQMPTQKELQERERQESERQEQEEKRGRRVGGPALSSAEDQAQLR